MNRDLWVIDVLKDIQKFATDRGHLWLAKSMDAAVRDFLHEMGDSKAAARDTRFAQVAKPHRTRN